MKQHDRGDTSCDNLVVHYMLSFRRLCVVTAICPLLALVICFVTAYIYQYDEVHETHCHVYNVIPSISAITGVSPQRYLWRICIALHIGPRIIIAAVYRAYHQNLISKVSKQQVHVLAYRWLDIAYGLNLIEIASLCGVTYISNSDNYPLHEKIFIIFMVSSLSHMLATIIGIKKVAESRDDWEYVHKTLVFKKTLFILSLIGTVGLVVFFLKHRLLCHDLAFSGFAFCEYVIACANMGFHMTVIFDFPTEQLVIAKGIDNIKKPHIEWKLD